MVQKSGLSAVIAASFILVGDETFEKKLYLQIMASVKTRLTGLFNLNPFNDNDSLEFIKSRLASAKAPETLFDPDALSIISSHCRGNRRQIMNMGTLLLAEAYIRAMVIKIMSALMSKTSLFAATRSQMRRYMTAMSLKISWIIRTAAGMYMPILLTDRRIYKTAQPERISRASSAQRQPSQKS